MVKNFPPKSFIINMFPFRYGCYQNDVHMSRDNLWHDAMESQWHRHTHTHYTNIERKFGHSKKKSPPSSLTSALMLKYTHTHIHMIFKFNGFALSYSPFVFNFGCIFCWFFHFSVCMTFVFFSAFVDSNFRKPEFVYSHKMSVNVDAFSFI